MIGYFDIVIELCMDVAKLHDIQESLRLVAELDALLFRYFGFFVGLMIWTNIDALFKHLTLGLVICVLCSIPELFFKSRDATHAKLNSIRAKLNFKRVHLFIKMERIMEWIILHQLQ